MLNMDSKLNITILEAFEEAAAEVRVAELVSCFELLSSKC